MIQGLSTVVFAMQFGQDSDVPIAISVIRLLTAMVGALVTGYLLVTLIRGIWNIFLNGTEYGTWPGWKERTGRMSTEEELKILQKEIEKPIWGNKSILPVKIVHNKDVPPGKVFVLKANNIFMEGASAHFVILDEATEDEISVAVHSGHGITELELPSSVPVLDQIPNPSNVRFQRWGAKREERHERIVELLREELITTFVDGDDPWMEFKNPGMTLDKLAYLISLRLDEIENETDY